MADLERQYTIPLRRAFMKAPNYRKTKRAVNEIKYFLQKHMKSEIIKIGSHLNLELREKGKKNPPPRVKVKVLKRDDIVYVELPNFDYPLPKDKKEKKKKEETKEAPKTEKAKEVEEEKKILEKGIKEKITKDISQEKAQLKVTPRDKNIMQES